MTYIILDTDVASFLFKQDSSAEQYRSHLRERIPCLAFQSVAELYQWAELHGWGEKRRVRLIEWLRRFMILPYDNEVALAWARIRADRQKQGRPISPQDAWIAACAVRHNCPLLTHNATDYQKINELTILTE